MKRAVLVSLLLTASFFSLHGAVTITPDNPAIRYNGVIDSTITSSQAKLLRVKQSYLDAPWSERKGDWTVENAGTQSGITIQVKTASPTVGFNFTLDPTYTDRYSKMSLYRNGVLVTKSQSAAGASLSIEGTVTATDTAVWTCVLPTFKAQFFNGVTLTDGYDVTALPEDTRPVYVAIGNSITHGVGQTGNEGALTYPYLVADALGYQLYNLGIGGSKINEAVLSNLADITPDVITVLWGYNDIVYSQDPIDSSYNDFDTLMTEILANYPNAKVYAILQTYTETTNGINVPSKTIAQLRADQTEILTKLQATHDNLFVLDGLEFTDASHLADVVHLNDAGAEAVANALIEQIGCIEPYAGNLYVSPTGSDASNGSPETPFQTIGYAMSQAAPGDTVFVLPGTYTNPGYGNGEKSNTNIAYIADIHGEPGKEIVLMSSEPLGAKLQFDGSGGLIFSQVSHLVIDGFEIEGPGASIDSTEAREHRLDNPVLPYYSGRGIAFWGKEGNHHITIKNNIVHHCPNSGIRANYADYITIENNDVYRNCWWSPNAESGVVIAQATNIDDLDSAKIVLRKNRVWDNGNYVVYLNHSYGEGDGYGQPGYTDIVDGQGLYITRSNDTYLAGRILIENNISVANGINGIGFHHTDRGIIRNNTVYKNGQYPDRPVSGITINGADDVLVYNNIVVGQDDVVLENFESSTNVQLDANLIWQGTNSYGTGSIEGDPLFVVPGLDPLTSDFSLSESSPAINAGSILWSPAATDIFGTARGTTTDIGAILSEQAVAVSSVTSQQKPLTYSYRNGTLLFSKTQSDIAGVSLYNALGRQVMVTQELSGSSVALNLSHLARGFYAGRVALKNGSVQTFQFLKK